MMKFLISVVLVSLLLAACGSDPQEPTDAEIGQFLSTPTTLSIAEDIGQMLDEVVQEVGGYDDYDDFRQDADRFEAELRAYNDCLLTAVGDAWMDCEPPQG